MHTSTDCCAEPIIGRIVQQNQIIFCQLPAVAVIVHVPDIFVPGGDDRAITFQPRAIDHEDVTSCGVELVFVNSGTRAAYGLEDSHPRDFCRPSEQFDLAGTFDAAHFVQDRREVPYLAAPEAGAEKFDQLRFSGNPAIPGVGSDAGVGGFQFVAALSGTLAGRKPRIDDRRSGAFGRTKPVAAHGIRAQYIVRSRQTLCQVDIVGGEYFAFRGFEAEVARR